MFQVGKSVTLRYQIAADQEVTFSGIIMSKPKWLKEAELAMSTDNPEFPMRVLQISKIVGSAKVQAQKPRSFKVRSKDKVYQVIFQNNNFSCNCMGFSFRRTCKHSVAVEKHLKNS